MDHNWVLKFIDHRIADFNIHRLISRFLKSGILENGEYRDTVVGAPQGGNISPIIVPNGVVPSHTHTMGNDSDNSDVTQCSFVTFRKTLDHLVP
ncbi:hypothetical protein JCM17380_55080 [Desulfosporosinus burensis]